MRRQKGICVVNASEMRKIKFEGIIVSEVNIPFEIIKVKEGCYKEGKYKVKDLFSAEIPEGVGINKFKEIILCQTIYKGICGFQLPEILVTEKVLKFLEG